MCIIFLTSHSLHHFSFLLNSISSTVTCTTQLTSSLFFHSSLFVVPLVLYLSYSLATINSHATILVSVYSFHLHDLLLFCLMFTSLNDNKLRFIGIFFSSNTETFRFPTTFKYITYVTRVRSFCFSTRFELTS